MADCCNSAAYPDFFDEAGARRNLRAYDRRGLDKMAGKLVDYMTSRGMAGRSVLEVGGGIGAIQLELLKAGADRTVNVELSSGYETVAGELFDREGMSDRVERRVGDFTELAGDLEADDVVMNRVICCYPFWERLMGSAVSSSRRFLAVAFPRDRLAARVALSFGNLYCKVRRIDFRSFIHPPEAIVDAARNAGFEVAFRDRNFIWHGVVFERTG